MSDTAALRTLALELARADTTECMLTACATAAMTVAEAECIATYQRNPTTGVLDLSYHSGLSDGFLLHAESFPTFLPGVREGSVVSVRTGLPADPAQRACCVADGLKAFAAFPVVSNGRLYGVIHLASRTRDRFADDRVAEVASMVQIAAVAIGRLESEAASGRRARYADVVGSCAAHLVGAAERDAALHGVLDSLLAATGVNRAYIFQNVADEALGLCMQPVVESLAEGMAPMIASPGLRLIPYAASAPALLGPLAGGQLFSALVRDLGPPERDLLQPQGVRSVVAVPIPVGQAPWGFIVLLDCFADRVWSEDDVRALRTIASLIGSFVSRRLAEDAVRDSEARYRAIVEGFDGMIYVCSQAYRVLYANAAVHARAGRDVTGEACYRALHGKSERCSWCVADRVFSGETVRSEAQSPLDDRWYYSVSTPIHHTDGTVSMQAMVLDITERKQAEEAGRALAARLAEAQRLESLGVLAGGVAHDFNNLLAAILGHAELASLHMDGSAPARANLDSIQTAAQRAAELTSQMLACAGKGRFVIRVIDLNEIVTDAVRWLSASGTQSASVVCELCPGLPNVEGDWAQLRHVVLSLLTNACEAIDCGAGTVTMRTGVLPTEPGQPTGWVFLEVSDTGHGMDEATRARVFEPFFTTKFTGRGLGLAAVQGIVRGHGGAIDLESAAGLGTTFRVMLPAARQVGGDESEARPAS